MKKLLNASLLIIAVSSLSACSTTFKERKAPCPPTASLSENPCNPMPINIAAFLLENGVKNS